MGSLFKSSLEIASFKMPDPIGSGWFSVMEIMGFDAPPGRLLEQGSE
jgi:hypothetical protein